MNTSTSANTVSIILAIVVTIIMLLDVALTPLLRESPDQLPAAPAKPPFSFSRFQLFLWTLVIAPLFVLHWAHSCLPPCQDMINQTALILLGISAGTTVSAGIVTSVQKTAAPPAPAKANRTSVNFWTDILIDNNGQFSIVRLQQLIFTIIYLGIFITEFFAKFQFPDFGSNAYILMGISTGAYVVGKSLNV